MDKTANTISSQEKGKLARAWNHDITFHEVYPGKVHYTDKIKISAGLLSPVIWLFAHVFLPASSARWKLLIEKPRGFGKNSSGDKG